MSKQVTKITRDLCRAVEADVKEALGDIAAKHGIALDDEMRWRFNSSHMSLPIKFVLTSEAKGAQGDERKQEWDLNCQRWKLKPEHFGQEFKFHDGTYKIVGCKPSSPKNCIVIAKIKTRTGRASNGKEYICPPSEVLRALGEDTADLSQFEEV